MLLGSIATCLVEICCKAISLRSQWQSNEVRLYWNVSCSEQMFKVSMVTFLVEIK